MFFWGSYNFQVAQQIEDNTKPPLRYPIYVPPCLSTLPDVTHSPSTPANHDRSNSSHNTNHTTASSYSAAATLPAPHETTSHETTLHQICHQRLRVSDIACGLKHAVVLLELPNATGSSPRSAAPHASTLALFGLGNNQHGQLGARVASYTHTLTRLRLEELAHGGVVSMACGARHTLLATTTGLVYASGDNSFGQLGLSGQEMAAIATRRRSLSLHSHRPAGMNRAGGGSMSYPGPPGAGSACLFEFTSLTGLPPIRRVFACNNVSFALDSGGGLYSWGESQYGQLCHNDKGARLDPRTLHSVQQNITTPQRVRWFDRQRVTLVDVAAGKSHVVCRSAAEVYTAGEGYFGKLGHGDVTERLEPTRVHFPPRKQPERLVDIAAGDDHTLVLKENSALGSVVYYFGKLSNMDGQLTPQIVPVPDGALSRVFGGRGNQSFVLSEDGRLYVWGRHSCTSVYNGTGAAVRRSEPHAVEVLRRYRVTGVAVGGTFVMAYASELDAAWELTMQAGSLGHTEASEAKDSSLVGDGGGEDSGCVPREKSSNKAHAEAARHGGSAPMNRDGEERAQRCDRAGWDVVVPHDLRVNTHNDGDPENVYERGTQSFMRLYLGETFGLRYAAGIPAPPGRSAKVRFAFQRVGAHGLTVGQKVRLWMTDVYALGLVTAVVQGDSAAAAAAAIGDSRKRNMETRDDGDVTGTNRLCALGGGQRVAIEWQRDDWHDEVLTLCSEDETYNEENVNRWQPIWFTQNEGGSYVVEKVE